MSELNDDQRLADAIELFRNECNKWGYVSWHLPHHYKRVPDEGEPPETVIPNMPYLERNVFPRPPSNFYSIMQYAPPRVFKHFVDAPVGKDRETLQKSACFNMLKHNGGNSFRLKVNRLAWGNIKKTIESLQFVCDPDTGPSLYATNVKDVAVIDKKLRLIDYRVHLTHESKGLRDVLIWEDLEAPGSHYVTTYIWCFAKNYEQVRPLPATNDPAEYDDPDRDFEGQRT